mgnify:FL=1
MPGPFDNCVRAVARDGKVSNPYAVCRASMGTDKEIEAGMKKKTRKKKKGY